MKDKFNYETDATEKLVECGGTITIRLSNTKLAPWAGAGCHPHYRVTLKGPGGSYIFDFWGSIADGETGREANAYNILACLAWGSPGTFSEFCADFDYSEDSRYALKTWKAVSRQFAALCRIFPAESARECLSTIN